jgi:hypothetical protein
MITLLDRAVHAHMAHPAMGCTDALTDQLCDQAAPPPALPDAADEPEVVGMWDAERTHPGRWALLYAAAVLGAIVLSHLAAVLGGA